MMDRATFNRLAEECEAAICARLRDYGAYVDPAAFGEVEREMIRNILERHAGPLEDDPAVAGLDGVEMPAAIVCSLAEQWLNCETPVNAIGFLVSRGYSVREAPGRPDGIARYWIGRGIVPPEWYTLAGLCAFARHVQAEPDR